MHTVFRVEHKDSKLGPYQHSVTYEDWYADMMREHMNNSHPNKWEDYPGNHAEDYKYGFATIESLNDWFEGYLEDLIRVGFQVMMYNTESILEGISGLQLVFIPLDGIDVTNDVLVAA